MTASTADAVRLLGYLTFVEFAEHGIVGGYLLVNPQARPVEFHCSAPLRPSRAQEILYGPTLRPYLFSEQIGQALLRQASRAAELILTDQSFALGLRAVVAMPVGLILEEGSAAANEVGRPIDDGVVFHVGGRRMAACTGFNSDPPLIAARVRELASSWDFIEPFQRIREAIQEAQRAAA